ncbi:nitroreductase [Porphyromonas macacae]|uniref:Nitroreductase n=2 Tax=Porphyromonas macacae TaxID=28115 RepID=A0A0A2E8A9_9PORP|nr:nitroreductase family protein [Porphyromonas macacae]KGN75138.1 nitroreductase [Porphyromonas macacae]SUB89780.1 Oxygen-insensitive NADPH nitroreductase [Porphyromonas macacae]
MNLQDFMNLVTSRQSDRKFDSERAIDRSVLLKIIEAARLAPSATNSQPWSFILVTDAETRQKVASRCGTTLVPINHFARQAPAQIVVVEERSNWTSRIGNKLQGERFSDYDLGITTAHIVLAAEAAGLGSCILGLFREKKLRQELGIPDSKRIALVILLGYSKDPKRLKKRKPIDSILHIDKW